MITFPNLRNAHLAFEMQPLAETIKKKRHVYNLSWQGGGRTHSHRCLTPEQAMSDAERLVSGGATRVLVQLRDEDEDDADEA